LRQVVIVARVITVNDVLDGHVALDIECLDRIYLNAYVPILQASSQVVAFLSGHLGFPFPSPALFRQMGDRFRKAVMSFSDANDIPWIRFEKDEAKLEVMQPHLARQAGTGRSGVAAIGVAQEFQRVWTASEGKTSTGTPRWSFYKADRRVTCYYFYLWDADFGPAFIKVCAWFPVRHEAPCNRVEVKDLHRHAVAAAGRSWGQSEPGGDGEGGKQPRQRRDVPGLPDGAGSSSEKGRWTRGTGGLKPLKRTRQLKSGRYGLDRSARLTRSGRRLLGRIREAGREATVKVCGVAVARLLGQSRPPHPSIGSW
jgi:hypothetical protein